jgi:hypothetical protein
MNCIIEMGSGGMIYTPNFMKTEAGVQEILRFKLSNSKRCNVGGTDGSATLK